MVEERERETAQEAGEAPTVDFVRSVSEALARDDRGAAADLVKDLKAPDLADIIELLEPDERGTGRAADARPRRQPAARRCLLE